MLPLATAMLRRGETPAAVVERIEGLVANVTPSVDFMLGTALYEAGRAEAAEPQFRAVLERQPASGPALIALCECLLCQKRFDDAATLARGLEAGTPLAPEAARTEAVRRCSRRGVLPTPPRRSCATAAADCRPPRPPCSAPGPTSPVGGTAPAALPREAAPLLASMLEALLRVEEVDAFVTLLPLLDAVGLPARERSELLATMYLRRGFIDSAADEWIAVCEQQGPDAGRARRAGAGRARPRAAPTTRAPSPRRRWRSTRATSSRRPRCA